MDYAMPCLLVLSMLVVVTATMLLVVDTLAHILVVYNLGCTILDHILVDTGLDTSHLMGHSPIVGAHRCQRCTLKLGNSLRCVLVAHICSMCPFLLIFLFLSCCLGDTFPFLLLLL